MWLLAAGFAYATSCSKNPAPFVMGGAYADGTDAVIVPPTPVLTLTWRTQPVPWPPVLVLSNATQSHVVDLAPYETVPLVVTETPPPDAEARARSAQVTTSRPLPVGTTWRLYAQRDIGWLSGTEVRVVASVPPPAWSSRPTVRTGLDVRMSAVAAAAFLRDDATHLRVPPDATDAAHLAVWEGRAGTPIDYDRPPDAVAARQDDGYHLGAVGICEPATLLVPVTGGDDRVYGLRPIDTQGRRGPAVEVTLAEARANERAEQAALDAAAVRACEEARAGAEGAWVAAVDRARRALLAERPGCVAWADRDEVPAELLSCTATPAFERARAVSRVATALVEARTVADAQAALREGAQVPSAWAPDSRAALESCAAVPARAAGTALRDPPPGAAWPARAGELGP